MKSLRPYIARNLAFFAALMVALLAFNAAAFGIFFSGAVAHEAGDASPAAMLHAIEDTTSASEASPEARSKLRESRMGAARGRLTLPRAFPSTTLCRTSRASRRDISPTILFSRASLTPACWSWAIPRTAT